MKFKNLSILILVLAFSGSLFSQEQDQVKVSARLSLSYVKDYKVGSQIKTILRYKEERTYFPAKDVNLELYKGTVIGDEIDYIKIEEVTTNESGEAVFLLSQEALSADENYYKVEINNHPIYDDLSEEITFKLAFIEASIAEVDSLHNITAFLKDANQDPIPEAYLSFKLQRLFGLMQVGEDEQYETDEDGEISLDLEDQYYSQNGKLKFIIKLDDNETYGTIIELVEADFGTIMEAKDTFSQRTMWATAFKAPLFVLIVPNLLLIGIWGTLLVLMFNLYKIFKLK